MMHLKSNMGDIAVGAQAVSLWGRPPAQMKVTILSNHAALRPFVPVAPLCFDKGLQSASVEVKSEVVEGLGPEFGAMI